MKYINTIKIKKDFKTKTSHPIWWISVSVFIIAYIFLTIETATQGATLTKIIKEEEKLRDENQELSTRFVTASSLSALEVKALELGYVKPSDIIYILEPGSVAKAP